MNGKSACLLDQMRAGRVMLIVNTASACGFTPQFGGLENCTGLPQHQGLRVAASRWRPAISFGSQDPGSNSEIARLLPVELRRHVSHDGKD
jgi:glutathione peroxidase